MSALSSQTNWELNIHIELKRPNQIQPYLLNQEKRKKITGVPWNFYISKIDSRILFLKNKVHGPQLRSFRSMDWNSIIRKEGQTGCMNTDHMGQTSVFAWVKKNFNTEGIEFIVAWLLGELNTLQENESIFFRQSYLTLILV